MHTSAGQTNLERDGMQRRAEDKLRKIHAERKMVHGDLWPDDVADWFRQWVDAGLSSREVADELDGLYGHRVSPNTALRLMRELGGKSEAA